MKRKLLSVLLIVAMLVTIMPQNLLIVSAEQSIEDEASEETIGESAGNMNGTGTGEDAIAPETTLQTFAMRSGTAGDVTRIEWLTALVDVFGMTVDADNYPDNYYSDLSSDSDIYRTVMVATEFGLVDVEAGDPLRPDEAATREFVAHSFNICMGYSLEDGEKYTFSEADSVTYPNDLQIAIDRAWFVMTGSAVLPNEPVTDTETQNLLNIAKAALEEVKIDTEHKNQWEFAEGVIVLPDTVSAQMTDMDELTLTNCSVSLKKGDRFGVVGNGIPVVKEVVSVATTDEIMVVQTTDVDISEGFKSIDVQGESDISLLDVQCYDTNAELRYIVGGTEEKAWEDGQIYYSLEELRQNNITEVDVLSMTQTFKSPEYSDSTEIKLGDYGSVKVTYKLSNIKEEHKIVTLSPYVKVSADVKVEVSANCKISEKDLGMFEKPLIRVPIEVIGFFDVSVTGELEGSVSLNTDYRIGIGVSYSDSQLRMIKEFTKKKFCICSSVEIKIGIKMSAGIDINVIKGDIYAEAGGKGKLKTTNHTDGKAPAECRHFSGYLYANVGCEVTIKEWNKKNTKRLNYSIYDEKNSPIKVAFHYDDGVPVSVCARDNKNGSSDYKYYTPITSQYGYSGASSGLDAEGKEYTVFTYSLDNDKKATITSYKGNVSALSIPETLDGYKVVGIGDNVFKDNTKLRMVVIPDSVVSIGDYTFYNCINLSQITLSKGLKSIGGEAFVDCDALEEIEIPKSLEKVGIWVAANRSVFKDCDSLKTVKFEAGTTKVVDNLFALCSGLEEITIPDTVTEIGSHAFWKCSNLKKVSIPDSVTVIGANAFEECTALTGIVIPDSVISIGDSVFSHCIGLSEIVIPDSVVSIGGYTFYNCINLSQVTLSKGLKSIGAEAFVDCDALEEIEIPKSLETAGIWVAANWAVFRDCDSLKIVRFEAGTTKVVDNLFALCSGLEEITIPDTVTEIGSYAFWKCSNLKKVSIPDSVTVIGDSAFKECTALTEISIPNSVITINSSVFYGCSSIKRAEMSDSVADIGTYIFGNCTSLENVALSKNLTNIPEGAFQNCSSLSTITLPEGLKYIKVKSFQNSGLTELSIPDTVVEIENFAFQDNEKLQTVSIGKDSSLKKMGNAVFQRCKVLQGISLPDSLTSMGEYAFAECAKLSNVTLSNGLTEIVPYAFNLCPALEKIIIPYRVTTINSNAFTNCTKLTEVTIPRATKTIGSNTFSYPSKMTIYGITGTYAETYAKEIGATFVNREVPVTSMTFNQTQLKVTKGTSVALILSVTPSDFTDTITWRSSDTSVATVTDGTVKAVGIGTAKITALAGDTGAVKAECEIEVVQQVTSIRLDKYSLVMEGGDTYTLTATAQPDTAYDKSVVWSSSDESVATVSETGMVTAVRKGTAKITATAQDGSGASSTCNVTVNSTAYLVESLEELQSKHPYENNTNEVWVYTLTGAECLKVTFSSDTALDEGYDFIYIYDSTGKEIGKYTGLELAGRTVEIPGDQVRIKLITDDAITGYGFKVDSVVPAGAPVALQSITLSQTSLSLAKSETASLQVTFNPENTTVDRTVTWSSSNEKVVVVQADGTVTAVGVGNAAITAKVADKTAICQVTVRQKVEGLTLSSEEMTLHVGEAARLSYLVSPIDSVGESVEWSSSSEDVITVKGMDGLDYAEVKAVGPGTAEIVLTVDAMKAVCQVTVEDRIVLHYQDGTGRVEEIPGVYGKPLTGLEQMIPSRDGYLFVGWYTQPDGQGEYVTQDTILTNQWVLYAYWRQATENFWVQPIGDQMYTGKAIKPTVIVYDGDILLQEKKDYTISYKNNTKANNASNAQTAPTIIVKGKGNYSGKAEVTFKILPQDIEGIDFTIDPMAVVYNAAKVQKPIPSVLWKGKKLKNKTDFVVSYPDNAGEAYKAPGTYSVKIQGTGNFTGERTITLTITQQNLIAKSSVVKLTNQEYADGAPITPNVTVKMKKDILTQGVDYELAYENNCEIGTATVIITGKGRYCGVKRINFKIVGTSIAKAQIEGIESRNYDGSAQTQKFTVGLNGTSLTEGVDYEVSYSNNINVGTAKLTVKGIGKYSGTIKKSFKITAFDMRSNAQMLELEIGGQAVTGNQLDSVEIADKYVKGGSRPAVSVNVGKWNRQLIEGKDFTVTYSNNKLVTTGETNKLPTITIKGKGNYAGVLTKAFTIHTKTLNDAQMPVSMSVPDKGVNEKAGGFISKPVLTDVDGKVLKEGLDYSIVEYTIRNQDGEVRVLNQQDIVTTVGTEITVSVSGKGAYAGTQENPSVLSAVYHITEKSLSGLKIAPITKTYSGDGITLDAADFLKENGDSKVTIKEENIVKGLYYGEDKDFVIVEGSYKNNIKKGTASVTVKGCGQYGGTAVIKFKITQKKLSFLDLFKF